MQPIPRMPPRPLALRRTNSRDGSRAARIALVAPSLEKPGGQGVQARAVAEALRSEGCEILFVPENPPFPAGLRWARRLPWLRTLINEALYLPRLAALRRAGTAHVYSASYWSFLLGPAPALIAARCLGVRSVLVYHSGEAGDHLRRWGMLVHPWLQLADEIVVPSDYLRRIFEQHGYETRVVRNMVDTSRFSYRERVPLRAHLLASRNLEPHYAVDNTLRAFALIRARHPDASLLVAGCGSEEGRLRRLAASLGEDGIRLLGAVDPLDMPSLYASADLFVNSSVVDNQPVSILEAFAAGLPVVTTGAGGIADMVRHGETGLIVPPGDPDAMAAAVASLLENPERALSMARRARREAERHSWRAVREDWLAVSAARAA